MNTTALADARNRVEHAPPTWSELNGSRLAATVRPVSRIRPRRRFAGTGDRFADAATDEPSVVTNASEGTNPAEARTAGRGGPSRSEPPDLDRRWLLVAPFAGAVVLSAVSVLVEPNPLRTGTSRSGLIGFAVLIPFFLLCLAGTITLIRDATRLRDAETEWSPDPWYYVVPSAATLTALHAYPIVRSTGPTEELVGFVAGSLVVTLVASSILAGPAYLLGRRHRLEAN